MFALLSAAALIAWFVFSPLLIRIKRRKIMQQAFPPQWLDILRQSFPIYAILPERLQHNLQNKMKVFLAEKHFVGCDGLEITPQIRICIAAQACLLIANRARDFYPTLKTILVYPEAFVAPSQTHLGNGMHVEGHQALAGQSWQQGKVIVSWQDVQFGCGHSADGFNVSYHEFAHQLDQESGSANGAPILEKQLYEHWPQVLGQEYQSLQNRVFNNQPTLIDEYGASHPAEFFAVVSELYLERPLALMKQHPKLYQLLNRFYGLDPHTWDHTTAR